jgi:hypothetical protein
VNRFEIEEIIEVPVAALLDSGCTREDIELGVGDQTANTVYVYREWVIWGATARILTQFLDVYRLATK